MSSRRVVKTRTGRFEKSDPSSVSQISSPSPFTAIFVIFQDQTTPPFQARSGGVEIGISSPNHCLQPVHSFLRIHHFAKPVLLFRRTNRHLLFSRQPSLKSGLWVFLFHPMATKHADGLCTIIGTIRDTTKSWNPSVNCIA